MNTTPSSSSFKTDIPRRVVDIPGAPRRRFGEGEGSVSGGAAPSTGSEHGRKLIVGRDISLSGGEISACDHLVVEGRIEAKISDCRTIEVAEFGTFKGSAEIDEADIAGHFEGELTVSGRLRLRGTGTVSGTIRYGELEVAAGGRLIGKLDPISGASAPAKPSVVSSTAREAEKPREATAAGEAG